LTNSALAVRTGHQKPRVCNAPNYVTSDGRDAVDLAASAGVFLDPWQQLSLEVMLGRRPDGKWAAFEFGELVARQNGKGEILLARALAGLFLFDERLMMHSAHEFKTAAEAFLRIKAVIDGAPHLSKLVKAMPSSHGNEGVELVTGQRLRFVARSKSSGRGFTGDTLLLDEVQQLPRSAIGAVLPTLSARPNAQVCYFGTVPTPENDAEHWTSVRDRGRAGNDPELAWLEWSAGVQCDDLDDRSGWEQANPALGYRISEEAIARERRAMSTDLFLAERLSVWGDDLTKAIVSSHDWLACRTKLVDRRTRLARRPVTLGVDLTPDRRGARSSPPAPASRVESGSTWWTTEKAPTGSSRAWSTVERTAERPS
jgi:phage terminase large subunit-like protein